MSKRGSFHEQKLLLPIGVVILIIGIAILLLNPDPAAANWKLQEMRLMRKRRLKAISRITNLTPCGILSVCSVAV